jgi:hypothetical protein
MSLLKEKTDPKRLNKATADLLAGKAAKGLGARSRSAPTG